MDKISINNLFPTNKYNDYDNKPLDVYSLYNHKANKEEQQINMNIDRLISLREERKEKLIREYDRIFKMCMSKIHMANNLNRVFIIYEVPLATSMFPEYRTTECLDRLKKKLNDSCFESKILDHKSIFISWENLGELRKQKRDKEKEK